MIRRLSWALVVILFAFVGVGLAVGLTRIQATSTNLDRAWTEIGALRGTVDVANAKLAARGDVPVDVPTVTTKAPGVVTVVRGADGADSNVPGPIGLTGLQGIVGVDGINGVDGLAGADGADGSTGAKGADGANGADGPPGVGLASLTCQDDGSWLVTLTDATTSITPGPCRIVAEPVIP